MQSVQSRNMILQVPPKKSQQTTEISEIPCSDILVGIQCPADSHAPQIHKNKHMTHLFFSQKTHIYLHKLYALTVSLHAYLCKMYLFINVYDRISFLQITVMQNNKWVQLIRQPLNSVNNECLPYTGRLHNTWQMFDNLSHLNNLPASHYFFGHRLRLYKDPECCRVIICKMQQDSQIVPHHSSSFSTIQENLDLALTGSFPVGCWLFSCLLTAQCAQQKTRDFLDFLLWF